MCLHLKITPRTADRYSADTASSRRRRAFRACRLRRGPCSSGRRSCRYVGVEEQEDDGEPFEEKMARLTSELSDLFKQSHKLEAEIKEKLGAIGYELV